MVENRGELTSKGTTRWVTSWGARRLVTTPRQKNELIYYEVIFIFF